MLAAHGALDWKRLTSALGGSLSALNQVIDAQQDESPNK